MTPRRIKVVALVLTILLVASLPSWTPERCLTAFLLVSLIAGSLLIGSKLEDWTNRRKPLRLVGKRDGRGVEGHASQRRDGTGRWNPVQGILVHEQPQAARPGTLIAPTLAGIKPGRPSLVPAMLLLLRGFRKWEGEIDREVARIQDRRRMR